MAQRERFLVVRLIGCQLVCVSRHNAFKLNAIKVKNAHLRDENRETAGWPVNAEWISKSAAQRSPRWYANQIIRQVYALNAVYSVYLLISSFRFYLHCVPRCKLQVIHPKHRKRSAAIVCDPLDIRASRSTIADRMIAAIQLMLSSCARSRLSCGWSEEDWVRCAGDQGRRGRHLRAQTPS